MQYFFQPGISQGITRLDPEESGHCIRVLRKKTGDLIQVLDGMGNLYHCSIIVADPSETVFELIEKETKPARNHSIHIAIAPTKQMERIEWLIEKTVEIGIDKISFLHTKHSERHNLKTERLYKKSVIALKQSGNFFMPEIEGIREFNEFIQSSFNDSWKYIANADIGKGNLLARAAGAQQHAVVMIGPEGDFSGEELKAASDAGFIPVSLGPSRLRTETAGLVACMILNIINT